MPVTPDALARARNLKPSAVAEVLTEHYAPVHRLAHGLCGRPDVARGVVRYVMGRSIARLPSWDDEIDPENWFHHFTVLATRRARAGRGRPDPKGGEDALLGDAAGMPEPAYVAFLTALRNLPEQQQEAFILHHGERVGLRSLSLSMDCSTEAANNHLKAATEALQLVAGDRFDAFTTRLSAAYRRLTPTEELALPLVNRVIRRRVWPRRIARWLGRLLVVAILGAVAWVAWRLYGNVDV
jgi:DNA-directed RNA polymerase specialized sigma24 family protein